MIKEELYQIYNIHYLNQIDNEIDEFVKARTTREELIDGILGMLENENIILFNHNLKLVTIKKDKNENKQYEMEIVHKETRLLSYK